MASIVIRDACAVTAATSVVAVPRPRTSSKPATSVAFPRTFISGGTSSSSAGSRSRQTLKGHMAAAGARSAPARRSMAVRASAEATNGASEVVPPRSVSVVLLAGGVGKRMGANMPKQYLPVCNQPIALYSFFTFAAMPEVKEIVVVADPSYHDLFQEASARITIPLKFALPGKERQDSVFNGLQQISAHSALVAVHDSARPLVTPKDTLQVFSDAMTYGAAVLAVPSKATIKESDGKGFVHRTLDRRLLWEMQTPQVMRPQLLRDGFELVNREGLEVTDDVSIVEYLKQPVKITEGAYTNIKVTTPDDLLLAERIIGCSIEKSPVAAAA
ncbi:unnamed protein product [Closterium sp. NIES-53]